MEITESVQTQPSDWPLSPAKKERLEFASERLYDAREVLRKVLAAEELKKQAVSDAALDLNAVLLILKEMGVAVPVPCSGPS